MDVPGNRRRLHFALLAQGYARVAVERLTPAGDIDLSDARVPTQLDQTLRAATNATEWDILAQRFALLRQLKGGHFDNLYLQAREKRMRLVVVTRFGTSPLREEWFRPAFDYTWPIIENSDDLLERFSLPQAIQDTGKQLVSAYLGASDPLTQAAASLLNAALAADLVNAGPHCAFVVICEAGFTEELADQVADGGFIRQKREFANYPPYIATFLWDVQTDEIKGKDQLGGGTLSPTELRQSLGGL